MEDNVFAPSPHVGSADASRRSEDWQIRASTARVYKVRNSKTWAAVTIDEWSGGGRLDIQSDDGNFAYAWSSTGTPTLREFLLQLSYDYFMGKTHPNNGRCFDFEATIERIKSDILESRRTGELDKDEARERWSDIEGMDYTQSEDAFHRDLIEFDWGYGYCDYSSVGIFKDDPHCRRFWSGPWAALKAHWREELDEPRGLSASEDASSEDVTK
jgi:hypothetical protein